MKNVIFLGLILFSLQGNAECLILNSNGTVAPRKDDAHSALLSSLTKCPEDVVEYKSVLQQNGLRVKPSLVANRGRNNPALGSFSFFEQVTGRLSSNLQIQQGEFFFGHFTTKANNEIHLDQQKNKGQLLIELIAWDYQKKLFNFYELIGNGGSANWFYRGNSQDILNDNQWLYRSSTPKFGRTLRCSACHTSGGPIMKELTPPHNDWWTLKRPLTFGSSRPSAQVKSWLNELQDASAFSQAVQRGNLKLQLSPTYQQIKSRQSLQEQLRPLFCETEINIQSSPTLFEQNLGNFSVNSSVLLNPFFSQTQLSFSKPRYNSLVSKFQLRFPENNQADADHVWLTPVKGYSDLLAIQVLLKKGLIDSEFIYDVLAVDAKKNIFSNKRCQLLKLLPQSAASNWRTLFLSHLQSSNIDSAKELLVNLTDSSRNKNWYLGLSQKYMQQIQSEGLSEEFFKKLLTDREAVSQSEISQNPLGQILEPGFRVIFPQSVH